MVPAGASWVGALDMSGTISEWVADKFGRYAADRQWDPRGPQAGNLRIVKGGSWFAHAAYLLRAAHRKPLDPETAISTVGFRCVRDFQAE